MSDSVGVNPTVDKIISTIGELPASPAIVSAVMGMTSDLDANVTDISRVLAADQSLTAKVLKLSNSSFYGRSKEVKSLHEAILILGFFTVRSMVIATSTHRMFNSGDSQAAQGKLWRHTLSAAIAARQVAAQLRYPGKDEVFIAALLHDIGKLVLLQKLPAPYGGVIQQVETDQGDFYIVEKGRLGFTHCDVAKVLLKKWSFPESLTEAIFSHHDLPDPDHEGQPPMAYIINLGNYLAKTLEVGFADRKIDDLSSLPSARALGFDEKSLQDLKDTFTEHYQSEVKIFEEV
jgi:HD-like signal output (HDOD) protein